MPPIEGQSNSAPAVSDNGGDRQIAQGPSVSDNLATGNVPGKGVDNPPTMDFAAENKNLVNQNVLNDIELFDSQSGNAGVSDTDKAKAGEEGKDKDKAQDKDKNKDKAPDKDPEKAPEKEPEISPERRKEIDDLKNRVSNDITRSMDPKEQDRFYGSAIDAARNLNSAAPDDRQKMYDDSMKSVPPEQRETYNKAIGAALHDQGSNLRTANEPPVGMLIERNPGGDKIVGRSSVVDDPQKFQADEKGFQSAPIIQDSMKKALADVPADQQQQVGNQIGQLLAVQESNGLFAPTKDIGAREKPDGLAGREQQVAQLKSQMGPNVTDSAANIAVDVANDIAFANPGDMNKKFNEGMDKLLAAGVSPTYAGTTMNAALHNISKDLSVSTENGQVPQSFLRDKRLATEANPSGTIGAADPRSGMGDTKANHEVFKKASDIASTIRSTNTEQLGRTPTKDQVTDHVDRTFDALKFF